MCGGKSEYDNGNGSLMRILPIALYCSEKWEDEMEKCIQLIFDISSLTHGHTRSKIGCLIYSKLIADIFNHVGKDKALLIKESINCSNQILQSLEEDDIFKEMETYCRLWDMDSFQMLREEDIKSSGYIVHTLEAAIWCFLNTNNYSDCVLKAVNLGEDTDTVAAIAGGMAGLYYGIEQIPTEWLDEIARREWIEEIVEDCDHIIRTIHIRI